MGEKDVITALNQLVGTTEERAKVYQRSSKPNYCLVMDKFGDNLRIIHDHMDDKFSIQTVLQAGVQLLSLIEHIHELGYVFNDLKPDNILVGDISLTDTVKNGR